MYQFMLKSKHITKKTRVNIATIIEAILFERTILLAVLLDTTIMSQKIIDAKRTIAKSCNIYLFR